MKKLKNTEAELKKSVAYKKSVLGKVYIRFFLKPVHSNTTNIAKNIFIIPTEDIHKK